MVAIKIASLAMLAFTAAFAAAQPVADAEKIQVSEPRNMGDATIDPRAITTCTSSEKKKCTNKGLACYKDADAYDPKAHEAEKRELSQLLSAINIPALIDRASHLRQGVRCQIPPLQYDRATRSSVMGGMNYHVPITFDDGIIWIARIRRFNASSPPANLRDHIIKSEVATLMFLQNTKVLVPKVYDFALEGPSNPVGVGFILMEKIPGKSLRWSIISAEQKKNVMKGIADVFIELQKHPFDLFGCLDKPGAADVGSFARESLTETVQPILSAIGPFSNLSEYHESSIKLILKLILQEEMYSQQSLDAYLIHRFLLDLIPHVVPPGGNEGKFYLKHADDKGDHIMVDDSCNITGIIDWEWAHTAPPELAFNSPMGLLSVGDFYKGDNSLGEHEVVFARILEEKGHEDLAKYVWNGRLQHRFAFCCGYDLADWDGFLGLFLGLRNVVGVDERLGWDEWKAVVMERYKDDPGVQTLLNGDDQ
ncbi:unnamed protein product [Clonostachys rosea]|uniref:Aminoglycoside phosphotransferase domain-containing protein n=1 Tax=Bionectria ochroleuca TaxID=29856 RepID=A0ABY6UE02_BIOOC|nr:unnamed protein product [Clonostachys rosea]